MEKILKLPIPYLQYYLNEYEFRCIAKIKFIKPGVYILEGLRSVDIDFQNKHGSFNYGISKNDIGINENECL